MWLTGDSSLEVAQITTLVNRREKVHQQLSGDSDSDESAPCWRSMLQRDRGEGKTSRKRKSRRTRQNRQCSSLDNADRERALSDGCLAPGSEIKTTLLQQFPLPIYQQYAFIVTSVLRKLTRVANQSEGQN